jgi:hypothetical protein
MLAFLVGLGFVASAHAARQHASNPDDDLLTEVRAIRLELQRRSITTHQLGQQAMTKQLGQVEKDAQLGTTRPEDLRAVDGSIHELKRLVAESEQEGKDLEAQNAELTQQLATEQARWADFNNRLDELERHLSPR